VVLVVDDEPINVIVADAALSAHGYEVHSVQSPFEVPAALRAVRPDVVLLDVMMPGRNGYEVCNDIRATDEFALLPIVFMTALGDTANRMRGLEAGADEFLTKPVDEVELLVRVRNLTERSRLQRSLNTTQAVVESLATLMEARDGTTGGHCRRLTTLARSFGESLGLDPADLEALQWAGVLHDIGKVGVPDSVLRKPGPLNAEEWDQMRLHTTLGEGVVAPLEGMELVTPIIRNHHERWDGSGYPDGLSGEAIPLLARVFQVVDIFDALVSERPYKAGMGPDQALEVMAEEAGATCDPGLFDHFVSDGELQQVAAGVSSAESPTPMVVEASI
jgi:putative two-component system response regulator